MDAQFFVKLNTYSLLPNVNTEHVQTSSKSLFPRHYISIIPYILLTSY